VIVNVGFFKENGGDVVAYTSSVFCAFYNLSRFTIDYFFTSRNLVMWVFFELPFYCEIYFHYHNSLIFNKVKYSVIGSSK